MLSNQQIDEFHRNGFLVLRNVFVGKELQELQQASLTVATEGMSGAGQDHWSREINGKNVYFRSERLWQRSDIFKAAAVNPYLLECIGQLFGHAFVPMNDSMVCKIPGGMVPVEWHQDPPYQGPNGLASTFGVPNFDVDIYLDETTEENGCLWIIPEHHLVGKVNIESFSEERFYNDLGAIPLRMQPGDVGLHALSAPHGSIGNSSSKLRRVLFFHYMTKEVYDNCYSGWMTHNGGYSPEGMEFVRQMLDIRLSLGHDGIEGRAINWTDNGFSFTGSPHTPPYHWKSLIDQMSSEEIGLKKMLKWNLKGEDGADK